MASENRLNEHAQRLDRTLRVAWRARPGMLTTARAAGLNEQLLETGEVDVLEQIAVMGEGPMADLARGLRIDPSTATRAIDRLVGKGLVCRRRDAGDARRQLVASTSAGEAAQVEAARRRTALAQRLVKRFHLADQDEIGRLWPRLATAIDEVLGCASPSPLPEPGIVRSARAAGSVGAIDNAEALGQAWQVMRRARTGIIARAIRDLGHLRLEPGDIDALDQIVACGGTSQMSALASGLNVTASSATKAVDRLVRKGLARRTKDPSDGRVVLVSLSAEGAGAQAHVQAERSAFAVEVLGAFDAADQGIIGRLLPRIADAVVEEFGALRSRP